MNFIGRKEELKELGSLLKKRSASFVVIRGRRRIGKSRLIAEFCSKLPVLSFSGVPPTKNTTAASQREAFARQMQYELKINKPQAEDWEGLFRELAANTSEGPVVIVLDEISWIGSKDPDFLGYLKNAWDLRFSKNKNLILIVCGSVSSWIEQNILNSTGFVGRITINMRLKELPLGDSCQFWSSQSAHTSPYEIFKVLSVTGGVPRYLEEVLPSESAEQNINRLCFKETGLLFNEFEMIFHDLFSSRSSAYKDLLLEMRDRSLFLKEVYHILGVRPSGSYSEYMEDLIQAGFVSRDYTWDLKTAKESSLSRFRISDNYVRFYLKAILPHRARILSGDYDVTSIFHQEGWKSLLGLQFETLVLNNIGELYSHLNLCPGDVLRSGPFFQRSSGKKQGCQIDLLIQTVHRVIYLVEIKFSQNPIGIDVREEIVRKIQRLQLPRGFSIKPVLIHVNGVSKALYQDRFFAAIIDFSDLLTS